MDIEKMRKWLEITNEYKKSDFWSSVLKEKHPDDFLKIEKDHPKVDIYQDAQNNYVIIEIPGMNQGNLFLHLISNTQLKISGKINPIIGRRDHGCCPQWTSWRLNCLLARISVRGTDFVEQSA